MVTEPGGVLSQGSVRVDSIRKSLDMESTPECRLTRYDLAAAETTVMTRVWKRLRKGAAWATAPLLWGVTGPVAAHDPVFGLGPHTLFKDAVEVHLGLDRSEAGAQQDTVATLELAYGLTSSWTVRAELPYVDRAGGANGAGDLGLATKYRFWRRDSLGVQISASAFAKLNLDTAGKGQGRDATDAIAGVAYGYESRKWYRWAALRYRYNGETSAGLDRGDKILLDLVGGIRFRQSRYLEPDWVWMLELNGERTGRSNLQGSRVDNSGGSEWFVSPGLMWTLRNFALKTGVQFPLVSNLNGNQDESDYRARLELEWHL